MNKEQFEKELDEKLASLKEEMMQKFEAEKEDEFPKIGDYYWFICSDNSLGYIDWENSYIDKGRLALGNVFLTEEEAEFELERLKVIAELKKYAEPKDRGWGSDAVKHWFIYYGRVKQKIEYDCNFLVSRNNIYFESKEIAEQAVEAVGEDRLKKYYLGVRE